MPDGRGFFSSDKKIFCSHTDEIDAVWREKDRPDGVQRL
jgi:hypothetical protein